MSQFSCQTILATSTVTLRDVVCDGSCRGRSAEECAHSTSLVYPYRGVFMRHVGRSDTVAESNQVLFFNHGEEYRISHPIAGGDACLDVKVSEEVLAELAPPPQLRSGANVSFRRQRRRIDARAQALVALLRHSLGRGIAETLEAETLTLTLIRRSLGEPTSHGAAGTYGGRKLVDRAKLVLSADLGRRWTLGEVAKEVGVSPVYLTQLFQQVEAMPLYRYQLRLRLARALDLLGSYHDLTALGLELGFSSHSHFSSAFKQAYGRTPAEFQRTLRLR
ncbi:MULTISPECIES: AraC family transcriptional regulator [unclassified Sinorhizobium]|uniref:AraC family transcriptional regulator n=1 Tax=unclassified Sinorhizobium TaxID=2613772 RepID=UPI0024C24B8B|nr:MULTISPECIES: AraC family transcriptional regulator [unclassified Sinorhizobium]MDK1375455.1 AraC family transcriptional regulator [Sinorhizobium sp. 6-70]MDK1481833.1 AraC family transcriptional regulator [Sinorhizobium sp. 6-117]